MSCFTELSIGTDPHRVELQHSTPRLEWSYQTAPPLSEAAPLRYIERFPNR